MSKQGNGAASAYRRGLLKRREELTEELKSIDAAVAAIDTSSVGQLLTAQAELGEIEIPE